MATAELIGNEILVKPESGFEALIAADLPMGKVVKGTDHFKFPAVPTMALHLQSSFENIRITCNGTLTAAEELESFKQITRDYVRARQLQRIDSANLPPIPITNTLPWAHQKGGFWFSSKLRGVMLSVGMGGGKSKMFIDTINNRKSIFSVLFAPPKVFADWLIQFTKHDAIGIKVYPLYQSIAERNYIARMAHDEAHAKKIPTVILTNYEAVTHPPFGPEYEVHKPKTGNTEDKSRWRYKMVNPGFLLDPKIRIDQIACDESHRIKAHNSERSKTLYDVSFKVPWRICMTGTAMAHSPLDLFGQYRFLDSAVFGDKWGAFQSRYARMGGYNNLQVIGFQNQKELSQRFHSIAWHIGREVLDLLPARDLTHTCVLNDAARKVYDPLEEDFCVSCENGAIFAQNPLVRTLRLQQVANGIAAVYEGDPALYNPDDVRTRRIDTSKGDLLADDLEDIDPAEPVVIFYRFKMDVEAIKAAVEKVNTESLFKRRISIISGGKNELETWRRGETEIIAVQIASGGEGIDLTRSHICFFYSVGPSLKEYEQARARIDRPGQMTHPVFIHLAASGTVEPHIYQALRERKEVINSIIDIARARRIAAA